MFEGPEIVNKRVGLGVEGGGETGGRRTEKAGTLG